MKQIVTLALLALLFGNHVNVSAEESAAALGTPTLSTFGAGAGPRVSEDVLHLLDESATPGQLNAAAFDAPSTDARTAFTLRGELRVLEGGDGGSIAFLSTAHFGTRGPAPFLASAVEPNLKGSFAVGLDVHNPPSEEMFTPWGNYQDLPQREISLHWDGREIVKRVAPKEFRGDFAPFEIHVAHVPGGAEVTVRIADGVVYDRFFLPGLDPYVLRPAIVAGTRNDATTQLAVRGLSFSQGEAAARVRPPLHVEIFNHVLTNNAKTAYEATASLPPLAWAFGRVTMTIEIHDAGKDWDEWDRNGEVSVYDESGTKHPIVPFITSYRTPCRWTVDITHFRPLLTGSRMFEIAAGTTFYKNRGYMMSLSLDFHHGHGGQVPYRVEPLWVGTAHYGSDENHFQDFFEPRSLEIPGETTAARIYTTTTGHSQIGEFTPSTRRIRVGAGDDAPAFENVLWKTDCYLNPNRPQFGTWQFSRAGWAPGDVVRPWVLDIGEHLPPGTTSTLRYEPEPYAFPEAGERPTDKQLAAATHVVRAYLVLYKDGAEQTPAPTVRIGNVAKDSSAAKAGILVGDYLASYDGKPIDRVEDLRAAIQGAAEKSAVAVVVFRGHERLELSIQPGRMGISLANP